MLDYQKIGVLLSCLVFPIQQLSVITEDDEDWRCERCQGGDERISGSTQTLETQFHQTKDAEWSWKPDRRDHCTLSKIILAHDEQIPWKSDIEITHIIYTNNFIHNISFISLPNLTILEVFLFKKDNVLDVIYMRFHEFIHTGLQTRHNKCRTL